MNKSDLNKILEEVPVDYYQKGIQNSVLQKYWHTNKLRVVKKLVESNPKEILDVGCASGWFLNEIKKQYPKAKCYGIDMYKQAVVFGNKKYRRIHLKFADAHKLPYPAKKFDLVICTEVLEHVVNPQKVLKEIKRILSPKGTAIIEMDSGNWLFNTVWFFWTHMRKGVWKDAHIFHFNEKILETMIVKNGFTITKKARFTFGMAVAFQLKKAT